MDIPRKKNIEDLEENNSFQEIYDFLDSHLEKENSDGFSLGFSKNIIRKIEAKQQRRFNVKIYILISILMLMSIPMFVSFISSDFILMLFSVVSKYKFTFAFFIIAVILIQLGEKMINSRKDIR
ncbi:hypothetical protein [Chryseobacterium luteum]|uniref:Uncharacterized protein n=1 Tax=Chryseobacterium luteum TaxID=421531 RepID=A0A085ZEA3_9FLAO|nr:hypothetical protein [Chryseobacterium luteum]KFF02767.1 hypothetical protein IX38_12405 [Chryseobacterium luteum]